MDATSDALGAALQLHREGRLDEAAHAYRAALQAAPDLADAAYLLGLVLLQQGRAEEALAPLSRAIELDPQAARYFTAIGRAARQVKKLDVAALAFLRACELEGPTIELRALLGESLWAAGRWAEATAPLQAALAERPNDVELLLMLADSLGRIADWSGAVDCYRRLTAAQPHAAAIRRAYGNALQALALPAEAIAEYTTALQLEPDDAETHDAIGALWHLLGHGDKAIDHLATAVRLRPDFPEALSNLGVAWLEQDEYEKAADCFERALAQKPQNAETHNNLGNVRKAQGRLDEAIACYRRALERNPEYADAHNNLGTALQDLGEHAAARVCFQAALERQPHDPATQMNLALAALRHGDFAEGWARYEWRWKTAHVAPRAFSQPAWDGRPAPARTIMLYAEQGLGDTIQFVRFAPFVRRLVGRVVLECQRPLAALLAGCPGVDQLVVDGDPLLEFDLHAPLMSLPGLLGVTVDTIPAETPYLAARPDLIEHWRRRLSGVTGLRIGVNWHGRGGSGWWRHRNIPAELFARLAELPGVSLVSLQKDAGLQAAGVLRESPPWLDFGDEVDGEHGAFMDTAAIMKNLDLVITSDTAVPHLAGALGVPVWTALPFSADWRFLLDRDDSPWYPTMRLFRQESPGDWEGVFQRIDTALTTRRRP